MASERQNWKDDAQEFQHLGIQSNTNLDVDVKGL